MRRFPGMAVGLLAGLLLCSGCGKKTPPLPPELVVPAPIADLSGEIDPEGVTLSWSWPAKTEKGATLRRISEFTVERAVDPAADFCADCPLRYQTIITLPGGVAPEKPGEGRLSFRDQDLRPGYHYSYRVRSGLGWRVVSAPSMPVAWFWQPPLAPPTELSAQVGEREARLNWRPPTLDREGRKLTEALLYQVYRSENGKPFRPVSGNLTVPAYTDQGLQSRVAYRYQVRAARASGGTGEFSPPLAVTPLDLTPPPVPGAPTAVITGTAVRLFWDPLSSEDLGGFMIYRRRQLPTGISGYELLGQVDGRTGIFVDPLPLTEDEDIRHYALKSYDRSEPPNLSAFSPDAKTQAKSSRP